MDNDAEILRLRAEVAALKAQIDQQHEDLDHFLSGAVDDLPKIAALRKDAERYRWLKSLGGCVWDVACPDGWRSTYHRHDQMDAAIDAALADKPQFTDGRGNSLDHLVEEKP